MLHKLRTVLDELYAIISFQKAYIFGSISRPYSFYEYSGIDIGFIGLDDKDFFKAMSFISVRLGCDVDILQLENHRLRPIILKEGIQWKKKE